MYRNYVRKPLSSTPNHPRKEVHSKNKPEKSPANSAGDCKRKLRFLLKQFYF